MVAIVDQGRISALTVLDLSAAFDTVSLSIILFFCRSYKGGSESLATLLDGWMNISVTGTTPSVSAVESLDIQICSSE